MTVCKRTRVTASCCILCFLTIDHSGVRFEKLTLISDSNMLIILWGFFYDSATRKIPCLRSRGNIEKLFSVLIFSKSILSNYFWWQRLRSYEIFMRKHISIAVLVCDCNIWFRNWNRCGRTGGHSHSRV